MPNSTPPEKKSEEKPEFWTYMLSLSQEEWKNHIVYLTRENPKTSINGIGGYLTKLQQPFDIEDIKLAYGGYEFSYIMKRGNDLAYSGRFRVEAPPKYDPSRESGAAPQAAPANGNSLGGNADFQKEFISVLREELQRSRESNQGTGSEHVIEMLTKASERAMEIVTKQAPGAADPTAQLSALLAMAEKLANLRSPATGGALGGFGEIVTLLTNLGVISKPKTLAEQIADAKALQELVSGGGGEAKDWKAAAVQAVTSHLPEILDTFKAPAVAAQARAQEANTRLRTAETLRTVPLDRSQPQAQTAAAAPSVRVDGGLNLEPREAAAAASPVAPAATPISQEQYDQGMKVQIVNMMRYGATGSAIAAFLEDVKPELAKDLATYPDQSITTYFSQDPILKFMVEDPRWPEVLADAREYLTEEEAPVSLMN